MKIDPTKVTAGALTRSNPPRRGAASFNQSLEPTADGSLGFHKGVRIGDRSSPAVAQLGR
jgi:hypothetical protein